MFDSEGFCIEPKFCDFEQKGADAVCKVCGRVLPNHGHLVGSNLVANCLPSRDPDEMIVSSPEPRLECQHRTEYIGLRNCNICGERANQFQMFGCKIYGECSDIKKHTKVQSCAICQDYLAIGERAVIPKVTWMYGITTVPQRTRDKTFHRTLESLAKGGFDKPRIYMDGGVLADVRELDSLGLNVTWRSDTIKTFGNWALGLADMYIRSPNATYYAMFQDDFVTYSGLREYLESCEYNPKGYWNLYTFPSNFSRAPKDEAGRYINGWYESNQYGKGAVALIFNKDCLVKLFSNIGFIQKPEDSHRGTSSVDGAAVTILNKYEIRELVHYPSLVQHTGLATSMGSKPQPLSPCFMGEDFDARNLICHAENSVT